MSDDSPTLTMPVLPLVQIAKNLALFAHRDQMYGDRPYSYHLEAVATLATRLGASEIVIAAAWLHDTLEDTTLPKEKIIVHVGHEVADLVEELTDPVDIIVGSSKYFDRLSRISPSGKQLKLFDLAANMAACAEDGNDYLVGYADNFTAYRDALTDGHWGPAGEAVYKSIYLGMLTGKAGKNKFGYWRAGPKVKDGLIVALDPVYELYAPDADRGPE